MIQTQNLESKAAFARHPLHPMFVVFPVAFLMGVLVTDLVYVSTDDMFWARASYWLCIAGLVTGLLAAAIGTVDYLRVPGVQDLTAARIHAYGNVAALMLACMNLLLRQHDPAASIIPWGVALSSGTVLLLGVTGWLGGELAYRHHVGMVNDDVESSSRRQVTHNVSEFPGREQPTIAERVRNPQRYRNIS